MNLVKAEVKDGKVIIPGSDASYDLKDVYDKELENQEVFFGVNGEKVLLCSAPEGTDDLIKQVFHQTPAEGVAATSPSGIQVTLYRVTFANVKDLTGEEVSADVNAAVFVKGGKTYLLVFSDAQPADVILGVVDAV